MGAERHILASALAMLDGQEHLVCPWVGKWGDCPTPQPVRFCSLDASKPFLPSTLRMLIWVNNSHTHPTSGYIPTAADLHGYENNSTSVWKHGDYQSNPTHVCAGILSGNVCRIASCNFVQEPTFAEREISTPF